MARFDLLLPIQKRRLGEDGGESRLEPFLLSEKTKSAREEGDERERDGKEGGGELDVLV